MRLGLDDYRRAQRISRWLAVAPFLALTGFIVAVTVANVAHARWHRAGLSALLVVALALVAAVLNWWTRRQIGQPGWARDLSAEEFADPALRLQAWRRSERAKVQASVLTVIGIASVVAGTATGRMDLLIGGGVVVICGLRVLHQIHRAIKDDGWTQPPW